MPNGTSTYFGHVHWLSWPMNERPRRISMPREKANDQMEYHAIRRKCNWAQGRVIRCQQAPRLVDASFLSVRRSCYVSFFLSFGFAWHALTRQRHNVGGRSRRVSHFSFSRTDEITPRANLCAIVLFEILIARGVTQSDGKFNIVQCLGRCFRTTITEQIIRTRAHTLSEYKVETKSGVVCTASGEDTLEIHRAFAASFLQDHSQNKYLLVSQ